MFANIGVFIAWGAGFLAHTLYAFIIYGGAKESKYFVFFGLGCAMITNTCFLLGLKMTGSTKESFFFVLIMNAIGSLCGLYVPTLIFGLRFNPLVWVGVLMVVSGFIFIKAFSN